MFKQSSGDSLFLGVSIDCWVWLKSCPVLKLNYKQFDIINMQDPAEPTKRAKTALKSDPTQIENQEADDE